MHCIRFTFAILSLTFVIISVTQAEIGRSLQWENLPLSTVAKIVPQSSRLFQEKALPSGTATSLALFREFFNQTFLNRAPLLFAPIAITINEGEWLRLSPTISDPDGDAVTVLYSGWVTSANTFVNYYQSGQHDILLTAIDSNGTISTQNIHVNVLNKNGPPEFVVLSEQNVSINAALLFTVTATDPDAADGDYIRVTALSLPSGAVFANGIFTWIPTTAQHGQYDASFVAADAANHRIVQIVHINVLNELDAIPNHYIITASITQPIRMIGIPSGLGLTTMTSYQWSPTFFGKTGKYISQPLSAIRPGQAAWIKTSQNIIVDLSVNAYCQELKTIHLEPGWNQISNPQPVVLSWQHVQVSANGKMRTPAEAVAQGLIANGLFAYHANGYTLANDISPWNGYWIKATTPVDLVFATSDIISALTQSLSVTSQSPKDLELQLRIQTLTGQQTQLTLKACHRLSPEWEIYAPPPAPEQIIEAYIEKNDSAYIVSEQLMNTQTLSWQLVIKATSPALLTLHFSEIHGSQTNYRYQLRPLVGEPLPLNATTIQLAVSAGSTTYTLEAIPAAAAVLAITQLINYPNPFDPTSGELATIRYTLSTVASGTCKLYTMHGRLLRTIPIFASGLGGSMGVNNLSWDGRDDNGILLPNDVYFYLIQLRDASDQLTTGKGKIVIWKK